MASPHLPFLELERLEWEAMTEEERAARRSYAEVLGMQVNPRTGHMSTLYVLTPGSDSGRPQPHLDPQAYRAQALQGDEAAIRHCDLHHIPWRLPDGEWRLWRARWFQQMTQQTPVPIPAAKKEKTEERQMLLGRWDLQED